MRRIVGFTLFVLLLAACSGSADKNGDGQAVFDASADPIFATVSLGGGEHVWLDPSLVSVRSGVVQGPGVDASTLGENCTGNIPAHPDVVMNWTPDEGVETLRIFFLSLGDPTMVVVAPDGEVFCNDDFNPLVLDPHIEIEAPVEGRYAIFMGGFEDDAVEPGFLVFTSHDLSPATLDVAQLMPRKIDPSVVGESMPASVLETDVAATIDISASDLPYAQDMTGGGELEAFNIELDNHLCTGFVHAMPTFSFSWSGEAEELSVFFESEKDTTLVVQAPDGAFVCDDDIHGAHNLNPALMFIPIEGTYYVWVGSFAPSIDVDGKLTIAVGKVEPAVLTADMIQDN